MKPLLAEGAQARILEWVAISSSRGSSQPRDWTQVSCVSGTGRQILYHCATWEVHYFLGMFLSKLHGCTWYFLNDTEDRIRWSKHVVSEKANLSCVRGSMVQWQEHGLRSKTNLRINLSSIKHKVFTIMSLFLNHP